MNAALVISKREIRTYFNSPVAYIVVTVFTIITGYLFFTQLFIEKQAEMLARPQLDIAQIGLVCVLGYADFRFADCGWRKAYPKLDAFHQKMLERPSVKISVPPPA